MLAYSLYPLWWTISIIRSLAFPILIVNLVLFVFVAVGAAENFFQTAAGLDEVTRSDIKRRVVALFEWQHAEQPTVAKELTRSNEHVSQPSPTALASFTSFRTVGSAVTAHSASKRGNGNGSAAADARKAEAGIGGSHHPRGQAARARSNSGAAGDHTAVTRSHDKSSSSSPGEPSQSNGDGDDETSRPHQRLPPAASAILCFALLVMLWTWREALWSMIASYVAGVPFSFVNWPAWSGASSSLSSSSSSSSVVRWICGAYAKLMTWAGIATNPSVSSAAAAGGAGWATAVSSLSRWWSRVAASAPVSASWSWWPSWLAAKPGDAAVAVGPTGQWTGEAGQDQNLQTAAAVDVVADAPVADQRLANVEAATPAAAAVAASEPLVLSADFDDHSGIATASASQHFNGMPAAVSLPSSFSLPPYIKWELVLLLLLLLVGGVHAAWSRSSQRKKSKRMQSGPAQSPHSKAIGRNVGDSLQGKPSQHSPLPQAASTDAAPAHRPFPADGAPSPVSYATNSPLRLPGGSTTASALDASQPNGLPSSHPSLPSSSPHPSSSSLPSSSPVHTTVSSDLLRLAPSPQPSTTTTTITTTGDPALDQLRLEAAEQRRRQRQAKRRSLLADIGARAGLKEEDVGRVMAAMLHDGDGGGVGSPGLGDPG